MINRATNVVTPISVGGSPAGIAITPNGNLVFIANQSANSVSVINTTTNQVVSIPVGSSPEGVAITPDGSFDGINQGTIVLHRINTYSGGTTINRAVLQISADANLGSAPTVQISWQHEYSSLALPVNAQFVSGAGSIFTVLGPELGADSALIDAGAKRAVDTDHRILLWVLWTGGQKQL